MPADHKFEGRALAFAISDPEQVPDPHDPDPDTRDLVGYPAPMVDHKEERQEALDRWERIRG